jgi:hypothetical protein
MGEILTDNIAALEELFALASETVLGFPMPTLDGEERDAVVEELEYDSIVAAGGVGESGGYIALFKLADLGGRIPETGTDITVRDVSLWVLSVKRNIAFVQITAGDPVSDQ